MTTKSIHNAFINALLADATYVDDLTSPTGAPLSGTALVNQLKSRLTPDLAKYLSDHFEVVTQKLTDDNTESGFDATVFKSKDDGQVYVSMRGSEGLGDFRNDGFLTLSGMATEQVIFAYNGGNNHIQTGADDDYIVGGAGRDRIYAGGMTDSNKAEASLEGGRGQFSHATQAANHPNWGMAA